MKIKQLTSYPIPNEIGLGNTNESYIRIESAIDVSDMFPINVEVEVTDCNSNRAYKLKSKKDREFRINQLGQLYRDFNFQSGDEIKFTQIVDNGKKSIFFTVINYNRVYLNVGSNGAEIVNIDRLSGYLASGAVPQYSILIDEGTLQLTFYSSVKKRSDSPTPTDFYMATVNGTQLKNGVYYITIDGTNNTLEKGKKNKVEEFLIPDNNVKDIDIFSKQPLQTIFYGAPGTGKSYKVKSEILAGVPEENIFRTTFHPDYDYASFVGCYKPKAKGFNMLAGENLTEEQLLQKFSDSANGDDKKAKYLYEALIRQADMRHLGIDKNSLSSKLKDKGFSNCTYVPECDAMGKIYDYLVEDGYVVENKITYSFIPQVFTKAYIKAWEIIAKDEKVTVKVKKEDGTETEQEIFKPVYLVIEEINRGNCAQIFGDIFQLLDRNENGYSEYPIDIDEDLKNYLVQQLGADSEGIKDGKLCLPPNLNLLATMNTSDQSLFPMDSAFKRRWDWEYVAITNAFKKKYDGEYELDASNNIIPLGWKLFDETGQDWWEFIRKVNAIIASMTNSADKQLGYFFCKANDKGVISYNTFVNKVCFYLWNDVFRDYGFEDKDLFQYKETTDGKEETKDLTFPDFFDDSKEDGICESRVDDFIQKVLDWKGGKGESDN